MYKSCVAGGRSRGGFLFYSNTKFYVCLVDTSPVLWVDAPAGAFSFLKANVFLRVECMEVYSSTYFMFVECMQVLCYGRTLPQGLLVFFNYTVLYV